MNYDRGVGFISGLVLGGVVGVAMALLLAPASGQETREEIRFESVALGHRGQVFRDDRKRQARKMVRQGQKSVSQAQANLGGAIHAQKQHLRNVTSVGS